MFLVFFFLKHNNSEFQSSFTGDRTFSTESHEAPLFVRQLASCCSLEIHFIVMISFLSSISRSTPISTLNRLSNTGRIQYKASCNYLLLIQQSNGSTTNFSAALQISTNNLDNQNEAFAASTKAKVSVAIVLFTTVIVLAFQSCVFDSCA